MIRTGTILRQPNSWVRKFVVNETHKILNTVFCCRTVNKETANILERRFKAESNELHTLVCKYRKLRNLYLDFYNDERIRHSNRNSSLDKLGTLNPFFNDAIQAYAVKDFFNKTGAWSLSKLFPQKQQQKKQEQPDICKCHALRDVSHYIHGNENLNICNCTSFLLKWFKSRPRSSGLQVPPPTCSKPEPDPCQVDCKPECSSKEDENIQFADTQCQKEFDNIRKDLRSKCSSHDECQKPVKCCKEPVEECKPPPTTCENVISKCDKEVSPNDDLLLCSRLKKSCPAYVKPVKNPCCPQEKKCQRNEDDCTPKEPKNSCSSEESICPPMPAKDISCLERNRFGTCPKTETKCSKGYQSFLPDSIQEITKTIKGKLGSFSEDLWKNKKSTSSCCPDDKRSKRGVYRYDTPPAWMTGKPKRPKVLGPSASCDDNSPCIGLNCPCYKCPQKKSAKQNECQAGPSSNCGNTC